MRALFHKRKTRYNKRMKNTKGVILTVPSKGSLYQPSLEYLRNTGMDIRRAGDRVYRGGMANFENVDVLFQNANEIPRIIMQGDADIGITGLDIISENFWLQRSGIDVLCPDLRYGSASLSIAVPLEWYDIKNFEDLRYLAEDWYAKGRKLQIATKFPNLTSAFLREHHLWNFKIQYSVGSTELAPAMGFSDIIVDLSSTGKTLEANRLKELENGAIFRSQACLIGHGDNILKNKEKSDFLTYLLNRTGALHASNDIKKLFFTMKNSSVNKFLETIEKQGFQAHSKQTIGAKETQISVILEKKKLEPLLRMTSNVDLRDVRFENVSYLLASGKSRASGTLKHLKQKYQ